MITVLLVDDQAFILDSFHALLEAADDIQIVATASNGEEAITQASLYCPDVVVMDISMPLIDGIEATKRIYVICPFTHVITLCMFDDPDYIQRALEDSSYQKILPDLIALAMKGTNASKGSIMILDDAGQSKSSYIVQNGRMRPMKIQNAKLAMDYGLVGWVLKNQQPAVVDNTLKVPRWLNRDWEVRKGLARSAMVMPLVDRDRIRAVITLTPENGLFSGDDLEMMEGKGDD